MRPRLLSAQGESIAQAVQRGRGAWCRRVFDASLSRKIEVTGPDATKPRSLHVTNVARLEDGRVRGLMLNENGVVIDDGTVRRASVASTSSSRRRARRRASPPGSRSGASASGRTSRSVSPVTTATVAGPRARQLLARFRTDIAFDWRSMPHMSLREGRFAGVPARLYRVSFGRARLRDQRAATRVRRGARTPEGRHDFGVTPHASRPPLCASRRATCTSAWTRTARPHRPTSAGAPSPRKSDFIGKRSLARPDNQRADRLFVGLTDAEASVLVPGAHLRLPGTTEGSDGYDLGVAFARAGRRSRSRCCAADAPASARS